MTTIGQVRGKERDSEIRYTHFITARSSEGQGYLKKIQARFSSPISAAAASSWAEHVNPRLGTSRKSLLNLLAAARNPLVGIMALNPHRQQTTHFRGITLI